jgi:hypothetical protein
MIIIRLKGGMGNQLFQYAFGRQLAYQLKTGLKLDLSSLLDRSKGDFVYRDYDLSVFNINAEFVHPPSTLRAVYKLKSSSVTKFIRRRIDRGRQYIKETHFHLHPELLSEPVDNAVYEGWFQSPKYFTAVDDDLRREFTFRHAILPESQVLLQKIQQVNAVCLNVRRTDFLKVDTLNTTDQAYFLKAAHLIAEKVVEPHFFVFSDDIDWCRENIRLDHPIEVVDHLHKGYKFGNYLQLMRACKHFIIPNSSFAWWAVWLNERPDKLVIAPKNWFNDLSIDTSDLIPSNWIRL